MSYRKDMLKKALSIKESQRNKAQKDADERKKQIIELCPRYQEIEKELASNAIKAAKSVLRGAEAAEEIKTIRDNSMKLVSENNSILNTLGYPENYLEPQYTCKKCNDTGYIELNNKTLYCDCVLKLANIEMCKEINNKSPLSLSTFDTFSIDYYKNIVLNGKDAAIRMKNVLNYSINYASSFSNNSNNLFLQGGTGLGKTHISLAIANEIINKGFSVIYVTSNDLANNFNNFHFSNQYDKEENYMDSLMECDLLIIDDLGTEFITPFSTNIIYSVINTRLLKGKPLIINTNLQMQELENQYSQRFVSRIMGEFDRLEFIGTDNRMKIRK